MVIEVSEMSYKQIENTARDFPDASFAFSGCEATEQVFLELV